MYILGFLKQRRITRSFILFFLLVIILLIAYKIGMYNKQLKEVEFDSALNKVRIILDNHKLPDKAAIVFSRTYEEYDFYKIEIYNDQFENLTKSEKFNIVKELSTVDVNLENVLIMDSVVLIYGNEENQCYEYSLMTSNGKMYLSRNYDEYYVYGTYVNSNKKPTSTTESNDPSRSWVNKDPSEWTKEEEEWAKKSLEWQLENQDKN